MNKKLYEMPFLSVSRFEALNSVLYNPLSDLNDEYDDGEVEDSEDV